MLKENGKLKTGYIIAGLIVLLLTIGNSVFNGLYAIKSDSVSIVTIQANQKEFQAGQRKLASMIGQCQTSFDNHVAISEKNFQLVDKDIESLKGKDNDIFKAQEAQSSSIIALTRATTILTIETKNMKDAIVRLQSK